MVQSGKVDSLNTAVDMPSSSSAVVRKENEKALRESLRRLEKIVGEIVEDVAEGGKGSEKVVSSSNVIPSMQNGSLQDLLDELTPLLADMAVQDPEKAREILASVAPTLEDFAGKDEAAKQEILGALAVVILSIRKARPDDLLGAARVMSPLTKKDDEVLAQLKKGVAVLGQVPSFPQPGDPDYKAFQTAFDYMWEMITGCFEWTPQNMSFLDVFANMIEPIYRKMSIQDEAKFEVFAKKFYCLMMKLSAGKQVATQEFLYQMVEGGMFEKLFALPEEAMCEFMDQFESEYDALARGDQSVQETLERMRPMVERLFPSEAKEILKEMEFYLELNVNNGVIQASNPNKILCDMMRYCEMYKVTVGLSLSGQSELGKKLGEMLVKMAQELREKIEKQVEEMIRIKRERPPECISWLIGGLMTLLSAVIAAATGGVAGAITALLIGAFLNSPAASKMTEAIATAVANNLEQGFYEDFKKQIGSDGKPISDSKAHELAKEKAMAVGNIIAKLVLIVVVTVVSLGGSSFTNAANTVGSKAAIIGKSVGFQALNSFFGSGMIGDFMHLDPLWCQDHQDAVMGISIASQVVGAILGILTALSLTKSLGPKQAPVVPPAGPAGVAGGLGAPVAPPFAIPVVAARLSWFKKFFASERLEKFLIKALKPSHYLEVLGHAGEGVVSALNGDYLRKTADLTAQMGDMEAELSVIDQASSVTRESVDQYNESTEAVIKAITLMMLECFRKADFAWSKFNNALRSA